MCVVSRWWTRGTLPDAVAEMGAGRIASNTVEYS